MPSRIVEFSSFLRREKDLTEDDLLKRALSKFLLLFEMLEGCVCARVNSDGTMVRIEGPSGKRSAFSRNEEKNVPLDRPPTESHLESLLLTHLSESSLTAGGETLFVPLKREGENPGGGILFVGREGESLDEVKDDLVVCAGLLSYALENARMKETVRELSHQNEVISATSRLSPAVQEARAREIVRKVAEISSSIFDSPLTLTYRKEGEVLVLEEALSRRETRGRLTEADEVKEIPLSEEGTASGEWFFGHAYYTRKVEERLLPISSPTGLKRVLTIPIYPFGKDVHFIVHLFDAEDPERFALLERIASPFSELASVAVESELNKFTLFTTMSELAEEKKKLSWLNRLSLLLGSSLDIEESLKKAVNEILSFLDVTRCGIALVSEGQDEAHLLYVGSKKHIVTPPGGKRFSARDYPNFANPAQTRKPLLLNNAHSHPLTEAERETLREYEVAHLLVVPALHHGETVGLLVLSRSDEEKKFTPPEVETALALAAQMGSAIHNASLYRKALERETEWVHTFNSITDMLFILDRDFSLLSCNEVFLQKYGWRREDVLGRKCYDLFECSKYPSNRCEHIRCIEEKSPIETFYEDFNLSGKFRVKVSPIFDERGEVVKTVHLVQDVTKEKEYEEKLNESLRKTKEMSEYLTALLDSSPDCIISADQKGNIVFINRGAEELLGYGEDELVGKHVSEVYPSLEEARRVGRAMKENGGKVRNFHSRLRKKDGELIDVLISVATLHDAEGNKRGTVGISKDISQLKKMEEHLRQAEKLTALGKLASGIAHDFNNLLTAIAMRVELLKMKISDEDAIKELSIIENAALRGTSTVEKLKSFYRKEPGKMSPVNLNDVIREAAEITSPRWKNIAESRGIRFDLELKLDNNLKKIEGNYGELKDAFINLFINAIDAMPEGGTIRVVTSNVFDSVRVVFSDTGVGMDDEVKVRAFEPFFSTKGEKGTGLGLSTVYGIVTRHGGSLEMETEKGKGTSFTLTFPIMRKSDSEEAGREESPKPPPSLSGVTVYLFEDEEDIRASLETLMRERGARVFSFGDPEKGIQEVTSLMEKDGEKGKRVVITDLGMPGLNGFEVTRRIKEKNGSVPVVMLTGWGTFVEPSHAKTQGVDRVVSKPVKMDDLLAAVGDLLGLSG